MLYARLSNHIITLLDQDCILSIMFLYLCVYYLNFFFHIVDSDIDSKIMT